MAAKWLCRNALNTFGLPMNKPGSAANASRATAAVESTKSLTQITRSKLRANDARSVKGGIDEDIFYCGRCSRKLLTIDLVLSLTSSPHFAEGASHVSRWQPQTLSIHLP